MKTNKKKKVLIALDYNPTAQKVAEVGFSMAKSMNAEITLLHVISDPVLLFLNGVLSDNGIFGIWGNGPSAIREC